MKKFSVLFFLFSICLVSCAGEDDDDGVSVGGGSGPCKGVICSGHGTCYEIGDNLVSCNCEEGYVAEGIDCVLDDGNGNGTDTGSDPCAGVTCSGHGNCYEKDGKPACNCEQGYDAQGTNCVEEGSSDPCAGKDCNNHGTCNASTGQCECEEGWRGDNCESFDNGGPWKVTVTGDVNEEIEFKYIYCSSFPSESDSSMRRFAVGFNSNRNATTPYFAMSVDPIVIGPGSYNENTNNLEEMGFTFELDGIKSYYLSPQKDFEIEIIKFIDKKYIEGYARVNSGVLSDSDDKQIVISPKELHFKCSCLYDGTNSECGEPH